MGSIDSEARQIQHHADSEVPDAGIDTSHDTTLPPIQLADSATGSDVPQSSDVFIAEEAASRLYTGVRDPKLRTFLEEQVEKIVNASDEERPLREKETMHYLSDMLELDPDEVDFALRYLHAHAPFNHLFSYVGKKTRQNAVFAPDDFRFLGAFLYLATTEKRETGDGKFQWAMAEMSIEEELAGDTLASHLETIRERAREAQEKWAASSKSPKKPIPFPAQHTNTEEQLTMKIVEGHMPEFSERQLEELTQWDRNRLAELQRILKSHEDFEIAGPQVTKLPPEAIITLESLYALAIRQEKFGLKFTSLYVGELRQFIKPAAQLMDLQFQRAGQETNLAALSQASRIEHEKRNTEFYWALDQEHYRDTSIDDV